MAAAAPLRSMTGFGRGRAENALASAEFELRTVNGKGFHAKVRVPSDRLELEPKVEALLRQRIERGSIHAFARVKVLEGRAAEIDHAVVRSYRTEWREVEKELGLEVREPSLAELLALPGALGSAEESSRTTRAVEKLVVAATKDALDALAASREKEGTRLQKELLRLVKQSERLRTKAAKMAPRVSKENGERLRERIEQAWAMAGVGEPLDLTRELVVLVEKADVREEIARLGIHLDRLQGLIEAGGACGRELEFVIQECHREVTTLGNKSNDTRLSEVVVGMKLAVGQLKEQAANVE